MRHLFLGRLVKLMQLGLEELLVGKPGLVFGDDGRRCGAAQCVFNHFLVFRGAEQHADRRVFVGFFHVAVERSR